MYAVLRRSGKRALSSLSTKPSPSPPSTTQISAFTHTPGEEELKSKFERWMVEHEKSYNSLVEKEKRFKIFKKKLRYIEKENAKPNRIYSLGLNRFSDLTGDDFHELYCMNGMNSKYKGMGTDSDLDFNSSSGS